MSPSLPRQSWAGNISGGMSDTPFNVLMEQAVKLKGQEMDSQKKKFLLHPEHVQHTVYHPDEVTKLRKLDSSQRIMHASAMKTSGNELLGKEDVYGAIDLYEKALGLFHWISNSDPEWRKNGIRDSHTKEHSSLGGSDNERADIKALRTALLGNLCLAHTGNREFRKAVDVCTYGLRFADDAPKLWFRRAKARLASPGAGATDLNMAIEDLRRAAALLRDAADTPSRRLAGAVRKELKARLAERQAISSRDKAAFQSMFERGRIYPEDEARQRRRRIAEGTGDQRGSGARGGAGVPGAEPGARSPGEEAEELLRVAEAMERDGREEEAEEIRAHVRSWRESRARPDHEARQTGADVPDFSNPTPEMEEEARKHGIDLRDPSVVAELEKLRSGIASQTVPPDVRKRDRQKRAYIYGALAATAFMIWRLYMSGLLSRMLGSENDT